MRIVPCWYQSFQYACHLYCNLKTLRVENMFRIFDNFNVKLTFFRLSVTPPLRKEKTFYIGGWIIPIVIWRGSQ